MMQVGWRGTRSSGRKPRARERMAREQLRTPASASWQPQQGMLKGARNVGKRCCKLVQGQLAWYSHEVALSWSVAMPFTPSCRWGR